MPYARNPSCQVIEKQHILRTPVKLGLGEEAVAGTMLTHPGVYCLRTNVIDWDQKTL